MYRFGMGDALPSGVTTSPVPISGALPPCPSIGVSKATSQGINSGIQLWQSDGFFAPLEGLMSFGVPDAIQHNPDGSACQPASMGQDAIVSGVARAVVTAGPVLAVLWLLFRRKR